MLKNWGGVREIREIFPAHVAAKGLRALDRTWCSRAKKQLGETPLLRVGNKKASHEFLSLPKVKPVTHTGKDIAKGKNTQKVKETKGKREEKKHRSLLNWIL